MATEARKKLRFWARRPYKPYIASDTDRVAGMDGLFSLIVMVSRGLEGEHAHTLQDLASGSRTLRFGTLYTCNLV